MGAVSRVKTLSKKFCTAPRSNTTLRFHTPNRTNGAGLKRRIKRGGLKEVDGFRKDFTESCSRHGSEFVGKELVPPPVEANCCM